MAPHRRTAPPLTPWPPTPAPTGAAIRETAASKEERCFAHLSGC